MTQAALRGRIVRTIIIAALVLVPSSVFPQGVTTGSLTGVVSALGGEPLPVANIVAVHLPTGTQYRASITSSGRYNIPNMRVGGPYRITATSIGYEPRTEDDFNLGLGQTARLDFRLRRQAVELGGVLVTAEKDAVLNPGRTGASMIVNEAKVSITPSIKRSTRDLTRLDPRSDGNMSFGGRNWLYNNISVDGSYFNNPFGLDDPSPGGQTNAEPVPYDAVAELQVSLAPFDVREGGFTGANINTVTRSGTNQFRGSAYSFARNDAFQGNTVSGTKVIANPDLSYNQSGVSLSGPLMKDKLFFYLNGEIERTKDPGSNFVASSGGASGLGVSRVEASVMDAIRQRMITEYDYDPGDYQGYFFHTDNNKLIAKLDWNINPDQNLSFRFNYLDAKRDLGPHPFVLSFGNTGRGPNESSLPFYKSGYAINNDLYSYALEHNSRSRRFANRFFASYNRFRDFREPFSEDFPTIDIGEGGVTYTTLGHEPFSINNILDQDVWQLTNNFSYFRGKHVFTLGGNFESFDFFNSFNIFRHGVFFLPGFIPVGSTYSSLDEFFAATTGPGKKNFASMIGGGPTKGEKIHVGQLSFYVQDELLATDRFRLTMGVRADFPMYFTDPVDNPFSRSLIALDENRQPEVVDQSKLPDTKPIFSPRIGFNWNARGERDTQIRGGTGIFTGRVPFVWVGNVISNPGANPNIGPPNPLVPTKKGSVLAQSFDLNAMDPDFEWPQVWTTDIAVDQRLPWNTLGTLEVMYGKDLKGVYVRNADLRAPVRTLIPDGRPYYGGFGNNELNPDGAAGIYVIDNTDDGYSFNITGQLRKTFSPNADASIGYSYNDARNSLRSSEIASVLWSSQPNRGDPNKPDRSYSEFGQRHRFVGSASYAYSWSPRLRTQVGVFAEVAEGNRFAGAGGNRYSFIYAGDVNGDGQGGNDLIYIPRDQTEIVLLPLNGVSPADQWARLDAFIEQDDYLSANRGKIAERFGAVNPWYSNIDMRVLQDIAISRGTNRHAFQISLDVLNVPNLLNSSWGVRKVASASATSPLTLVDFNAAGVPRFNFTGPSETFVDDPGLFSRWRAQLGLRYMIN